MPILLYYTSTSQRSATDFSLRANCILIVLMHLCAHYAYVTCAITHIQVRPHLDAFSDYWYPVAMLSALLMAGDLLVRVSVGPAVHSPEACFQKKSHSWSFPTLWETI